MDHCGYCDAAKALLKSMSYTYEEINISDNYEERVKLVQKTGHRTLPQIFIDGTFIGGYSELKAHLEKHH